MVGLMPQSRVRVKELEAGNNRFQRMCANMALENEAIKAVLNCSAT